MERLPAAPVRDVGRDLPLINSHDAKAVSRIAGGNGSRSRPGHRPARPTGKPAVTRPYGRLTGQSIDQDAGQPVLGNSRKGSI